MSKQLKKLKKILLNHKGKKHAVTSREIAMELGIEEDDTHAQTRGLILDCIEEYHIPVAATKRGYFVIESKKELDKYIDNLNKRIKGIEKRRDETVEYFWEWDG